MKSRSDGKWWVRAVLIFISLWVEVCQRTAVRDDGGEMAWSSNKTSCLREDNDSVGNVGGFRR